MAWYNNLTSYLGLSQDKQNDYINKGTQEASDILNGVDTSASSAEDLYNQGRGAAGVAAADKAGIAKKEAKAASVMNGGGKLTSALQGAQGAVDASQTGYDETANSAANLAASQENAAKNRELSNAQTKANNAMNAAQQKASNYNSMVGNNLNFASSIWNSKVGGTK